jgi:RNA polymerase sigma factor (sigma-70 family)
VHDVFVSFLKLKRFQLTGSLKGFLATCVANAARNVIRANLRHGESSLDNAQPVISSVNSPEYEAIFGEEKRLLTHAIWELPYEQREVVLLHVHSGMKFAAIAESQNVPINTVLGRYRYGLEKLRSALNGEVQK